MFTAVVLCLALFVSARFGVNRIACIAVASVAVSLLQHLTLKNDIDFVKRKRRALQKQEHDLAKDVEMLKQEHSELRHHGWLKSYEWEQRYQREQDLIKYQILKDLDDRLADRLQFYKWLTPFIADAKVYLQEQYRQTYEKVARRRPPDTLTKVNVLINEKKDLLAENLMLRYQLDYIKTLIPAVDGVIELDETRAEIEAGRNPTEYLPKAVWDAMSDREKNEWELERYKNRQKRKWEIGRDFERYIGWRYEKDGYDVVYFGIEKGLEDLGRDLIAKKDNETLIIQCKYWSRGKTIHEKHIAQLYGTVIEYEVDSEMDLLRAVKGRFITHTALSDKAKLFANRLGIDVEENVELGEYPLIKCNVSKNRETGVSALIYHLPVDQQYDAVIIDKNEGDCYAFTINEAESKGFRRAYRWHSTGDN